MKQFGALLLQIIVLELILGGGGRFTALGPISLRMILFASALAYTCYSIWMEKKFVLPYLRLVLIFLLVILLAMSIGFFSTADPRLIFEDIKPLSFFLILPFFGLTITDKSILLKISRLVIYGALGMSIIYILLLVLINTGVIPFKAFYNLTAPTEEFFYRGELAFFYKGFLFLCIGLIAIYFTKPKYAGIMASVIILAIILTFTRGFIFALLLAAFCYFIVQPDAVYIKISKLAIILLLALVIGLKGNDLYAEVSKSIHKSEIKTNFTKEFQPEKLLGNRDFSNNERKKQFRQVLERTTLTSLFFGHGFGIGVPVRPIHMEISYLEIFHKQGLIGLLFWAFIFYLLTKKYFYSRKRTSLAHAFYFGSLFIFFQSLTNQYFNNPIGMSFILISLVGLDIIRKNND
ncbi:hypothetical protein C900_03026 [Fulvivirga imtechensis AK7]|uniref:O-antigen ligase-related domain-containing protein n=1 Tax=Fulvivirga imtechensis AK7 TaxID=1237149 RepID=L8JVF6_9BACT|nr:O-antigen ligase family protein [Fulvivirga imtechensis]ELR71222.1 hypothetical protein C900_03026 [Fulvivirga imtechensis AK7]